MKLTALKLFFQCPSREPKIPNFNWSRNFSLLRITNETGLLHLCFTLFNFEELFKDFLLYSYTIPFKEIRGNKSFSHNGIAWYRLPNNDVTMLRSRFWKRNHGATTIIKYKTLDTIGKFRKPIVWTVAANLVHFPWLILRCSTECERRLEEISASASFVISCRTKIVRLTCQRQVFFYKFVTFAREEEELLLTLLRDTIFMIVRIKFESITWKYTWNVCFFIWLFTLYINFSLQHPVIISAWIYRLMMSRCLANSVNQTSLQKMFVKQNGSRWAGIIPLSRSLDVDEFLSK